MNRRHLLLGCKLHSAFRQFAGALALALGVPGVQAAGASAVITGMSGLFLEVSVQSRRDFCGARFKDSQPAWAGNMAHWQQRNAAVLEELRAIAQKLQGPPQRSDTLASVLQFKLMAGLAPAANLAPLQDDQAAAVCAQWLSDLEPAGRVDEALPVLLNAARKLQAVTP